MNVAAAEAEFDRLTAAARDLMRHGMIGLSSESVMTLTTANATRAYNLMEAASFALDEDCEAAMSSILDALTRRVNLAYEVWEPAVTWAAAGFLASVRDHVAAEYKDDAIPDDFMERALAAFEESAAEQRNMLMAEVAAGHRDAKMYSVEAEPA